jgi:hypothetical protein
MQLVVPGNQNFILVDLTRRSSNSAENFDVSQSNFCNDFSSVFIAGFICSRAEDLSCGFCKSFFKSSFSLGFHRSKCELFLLCCEVNFYW